MSDALDTLAERTRQAIAALTEKERDLLKSRMGIDSTKLTAQGTFGWAIGRLEHGRRVQRAGWNGKGLFLFLVDTWDVGDELQEMHPIAGLKRAPFIAMKTVDDRLVPWLASQTDMLATDWSVVE
jgi:hypothetical protein